MERRVIKSRFVCKNPPANESAQLVRGFLGTLHRIVSGVCRCYRFQSQYSPDSSMLKYRYPVDQASSCSIS